MSNEIASNRSEMTELLSNEQLQGISSRIAEEVCHIIDDARRQVAVYVDAALTMTHWRVGNHVSMELQKAGLAKYGQKIVSTVSRQLTLHYGRGYASKSLWKMIQVANTYPDEQLVSTLSRQLSWSHLLELTAICNPQERLFYQQMSILHHWSVRDMRQKQDESIYQRTLISAEPDDVQTQKLLKIDDKHIIDPEFVFRSSYVVDFLGLSGYYSEEELEDAIVRELERFILELGNDFAYLERQKRFTIDGTDYYLDLLFYHRRLRRLVAIDLKLGKFKPQYKAQMELYLKYMQLYDQCPGEEAPIGLLLCSEGNTEHIELMLLGEDNIRVSQYLTQLPPKQWFIDKLNRSIAIAAEHREDEKGE